MLDWLYLKGQKSTKFIIYPPKTCFLIRALRDNRYILLQFLWFHNDRWCTSSHWSVFQTHRYHPLDQVLGFHQEPVLVGSVRAPQQPYFAELFGVTHTYITWLLLLQDHGVVFRFLCNFWRGFHMVWKHFGSWNFGEWSIIMIVLAFHRGKEKKVLKFEWTSPLKFLSYFIHLFREVISHTEPFPFGRCLMHNLICCLSLKKDTLAIIGLGCWVVFSSHTWIG